MTDEIIKSILDSMKPIETISFLPSTQGVYAFTVHETGDLGNFGSQGQIIYVGISDNLNGRELEQHLATGQTGWSSLRRSIGAILKVKLKLTAKRRDKNSIQLRADKYKFDDDGELKLTEWMRENLKLGFWSTNDILSENQLRNEEEKVILKLKPSLDLDRRTRKFNLLAEDLDFLRNICREEVKNKLVNLPARERKDSFNDLADRMIQSRANASSIKKKKPKMKKKGMKKKKRKSKSVRAISTGFEMNRSRH